MKKFWLFFLLFAFIFPTSFANGAALANNLSGRFLLAVEGRGEIWYVNPQNFLRYQFSNAEDLLALMRAQGIGISNLNLEKIPIAIFSSGPDSDQDGLPNSLEEAIGTDKNKIDTDGDGYSDKIEVSNNYNPRGSGKMAIDKNFVSRQKGKIFLAVEKKGEAWYLDPISGKRFFLGSSKEAFAVLKLLALGINNANLNKIPLGSQIIKTAEIPANNSTKAEALPIDLAILELKINNLVNSERAKQNLPELKWNSAVANVAREHSIDLKAENEMITDMKKMCNYPLIHHEGALFGLYSSDRLNNRNLYYFSKSGENIALFGAAGVSYSINSRTFSEQKIIECQNKSEQWNEQFKAALESGLGGQQKLALLMAEIIKRKAELAKAENFTIAKIIFKNEDELAREVVAGWMNSPGHKANILDAEYDESGIGVSYVNGYIIATQVFIKRAACGFKDGACCQVNGYSACFSPYSCQNNFCRE